MKIQKGHYMPKELITSEALHEAVVKCFVAAGFDTKSNFGQYSNPHDDGLCVSMLTGNIIWGAVGETCDTALTLQQLFTAENGLQWPAFAECVKCNDHSVWFCSENGAVIQFVAGSTYSVDSAVLAVRQPNAPTQNKSLTHSEEGLTHKDEISEAISAFCKLPNSLQDLYQESFDKWVSKRAAEIKASTEREKVIEAAKKIVENDLRVYSNLENLYDAGMLVLPPKKSDTED